jgi:hypothetical protein
MLGQITPKEERRKIYLNIKDGAIVRRTPEGEERYSYVSGVLDSITQKERTFRGNEVVLYWYLDLRDDEGELYSLGFPETSNTFKSIILQLASEEGLESVRKRSKIKIEPYSRNGYDKVQVYGIDFTRLSWVVKELPPIEEKIVGGRKYRDDSKRMELITSLTEKVISTLKDCDPDF